MICLTNNKGVGKELLVIAGPTRESVDTLRAQTFSRTFD